MWWSSWVQLLSVINISTIYLARESSPQAAGLTHSITLNNSLRIDNLRLKILNVEWGYCLSYFLCLPLELLVVWIAVCLLNSFKQISVQNNNMIRKFLPWKGATGWGEFSLDFSNQPSLNILNYPCSGYLCKICFWSE